MASRVLREGLFDHLISGFSLCLLCRPIHWKHANDVAVSKEYVALTGSQSCHSWLVPLLACQKKLVFSQRKLYGRCLLVASSSPYGWNALRNHLWSSLQALPSPSQRPSPCVLCADVCEVCFEGSDAPDDARLLLSVSSTDVEFADLRDVEMTLHPGGRCWATFRALPALHMCSNMICSVVVQRNGWLQTTTQRHTFCRIPGEASRTGVTSCRNRIVDEDRKT